MFYEAIKISELLNCKKCNERLDEPIILPCSANICSFCVRSVQVFDGKFECIVCSKKHHMPDEGFPINEPLKKLLSIQPSEVYRSQDVETLKSMLNEIQKKTKVSFNFCFHVFDYIFLFLFLVYYLSVILRR